MLGQHVKVLEHGREVRMSRRTGNIVTLADILDRVDPDVARMTFLLQGIDSAQTFDLDIVTQQSMENPVYYVQYAHARIMSIGRKADASPASSRRPLESVDLSLLRHEREEELLRALAVYPDAVHEAAEQRAPQKISTWVRDFARAFHGFYRDVRVLTDDAELTQARLWLTEACRVGARERARRCSACDAPDEMTRSPTTITTTRPRTTDEHERVRPLAAAGVGARRRRGPRLDRRRRPRRAGANASARRVTSTTRTSSAPAAARTAPRFGDGAAYASKAFLCVAMAQLVHEEGLHLDVATGGELFVGVARRLSRPSGSCSTATTSRPPSCAPALDAGVGRIVVDSDEELDRLEALVAEGLPAPRVQIRVRPGVEAHTHEYIETGGEDSKFGFGLDRCARVPRSASSGTACWSSRGCTATSARTCSASTRSRGRSRRWSASCTPSRSRRGRRSTS